MKKVTLGELVVEKGHIRRVSLLRRSRLAGRDDRSKIHHHAAFGRGPSGMIL